MIRSITIVAAFAISMVSNAQTVLFSDDFESGSSLWTETGDLTPNAWIFNTCAGNGATLPGSNSMYITMGGSIPGCGATGTEQYAYTNSASGINQIVSYANIDASCRSSLNVTFDYRIEGVAAEDYAELVYSTDGGTSWIAVGNEFTISAPWTTTSIALPAALNETVFDLGIRFTYNNTTINGAPIAIDNFEVTGVDAVNPTIICPAAIPLYVDAGCQATIIDYTGLATATDNCSGTVVVTQSPVPGTVVDVTSSPTITLTATDQAGNTSQCQFTQTIFDTVSPTITCPGNQTAYLNAACELSVPDYSGLVTGDDNCVAFGPLSFTQAPPAGSVIGASTTVTYTVNDSYGNSASCDFVLQAIDTISPTVVCPDTITVTTTSGCDHLLGSYSGVITPDDNCTFPGSLGYAQSPPAGTLLPSGAHTIIVTVTDDAGNTGTDSLVLVVEDGEAPQITACAPNVGIPVDANCQSTLGDYTSAVAVNDNCSALANLTYTQAPPAGTQISTGTVVLITVEDEAGNSSQCQFTAFASDTTVPAITCPNDATMTINGNCEYLVPDLVSQVTGTDNCSAFGDMTVTQNPVAGSTGSGITSVLITLMDEQGNTSTCITTLTPDDQVAPTITCPSNMTENIGTNCDFSLLSYAGNAVVTDNCPNYSIDQWPPMGTVVATGTTQIMLTVTDAGGNSSSCSFDLDVIETGVPTITCPSDISTCDPIVTYSDPLFSDNCVAALLQTDLTGLSSGDLFPVGITTLEYTVIDSSANTSTCSFNIEVLEYPSAALILEDTIELCNESSTLLSAEALISGTGEWTVSSGQGSFNNQFANATGVNNIGFGTNVYTWTVSSPTCGSLSDNIVVINSQQDVQASTQDTILSCSDPTVLLLANQPLYGTGTWTTDANGSITDIHSANTNSTLIMNGWQSFVWTITNGSCPASSDTLHVFAMKDPSIYQEDTTVCLENDAVVFNGTAPVEGQTSYWSVLSGSVNIDSPTNPTSGFNNFGLGLTYILYSYESEYCDATRDTVTVVGSICEGFQPVIPTVITPGNMDGKNDLFVVDFLNVIYPDCHVTIFNRWGNVVFESTGYSDPWDGTYKGELLPMGTYFYRIELNDEEGQVLTGDISIIH